MRRTGWILAGIVVALVLFVEFVPICVYIWDGGYKLTVHIVSSGDPPSAVACYPVGRREEAERVCGRSPTTASFDQPGDAAVANPFTAQPLQVQIWTSGRTSLFGRELAWSQPRFMVVVAEWRDGRVTCKIADIPDGRVSKEMQVSVP